MELTKITIFTIIFSTLLLGITNFAEAHSGVNDPVPSSHSGYMYDMVNVDCFGGAAGWTRWDGSTLGGDDDGDFLCNAWETTQGLIIDFKTPASGTFPPGFPLNHKFYYKIACTDTVNSNTGGCPDSAKKDVYLEIDHMRDTTTPDSHAPKSNVINDLLNSFTNSPSPGVNLHIQYGEDPANSNVNKRGEILFHRDSLRVPGTSSLPGFNYAKENWYGTINERSCTYYPYNVPWSPPPTCSGYSSDALKDRMTAKRQAFHYGMIIYQQYGSNNIYSGWSEQNGNDFVVSLGAPGFSNMGTVDQQEGTIMHELGHTLGLKHGGDQDFNCKPNYLSPMSFEYQFSANADPSRPLDYSRDVFKNLNENAGLDENTGVGPISGAHYYYPGTSNERKIFYSTTSGTMMQSNVNTAPIDYDGAPSGESGVTQNINNISTISGCSDSSFTNPLTGYNDWANLNLDIFAANNGGTGAPWSGYRGDVPPDEENGPPGEQGDSEENSMTVSDQTLTQKFDSKGNEIYQDKKIAEEQNEISLVAPSRYSETCQVPAQKYSTHNEITYGAVRGFLHQHLVSISNKLDTLKDEDFANNNGTTSREILYQDIQDAIVANQKDDLPRVSADLDNIRDKAEKLITSEKKNDVLDLIEDKIKAFAIAQDYGVNTPKIDDHKKIFDSLTQLNNSTSKLLNSINRLDDSVSNLADKLKVNPGPDVITLAIIMAVAAVIIIINWQTTKIALKRWRPAFNT